MAKKLILQITEAPQAKIGDRHYCVSWLKGIAKVVKMTPVNQPIVFDYPIPGSKDIRGLTGMVPFKESFCAWDSWPENGELTIVVVSCKEFSLEKVLTYCNITLASMTKIEYVDEGG